LISRDIYSVFSRFFDGFSQILIKAQPFDQNERVLDKSYQLEALVLGWFCNGGFVFRGI
jgi:hypothetical protein